MSSKCNFNIFFLAFEQRGCSGHFPKMFMCLGCSSAQKKDITKKNSWNTWKDKNMFSEWNQLSASAHGSVSLGKKFKKCHVRKI